MKEAFGLEARQGRRGRMACGILIGTAVLLSGCAGTTTLTPDAASVQTPNIADTEKALRQTAEEVSQAMMKMAAIRTAHAPVRDDVPDYVPPALEQRVSLTFTGTVEETAKALATQVGYRFSTAGRKSATPIMVTVNADDKPVVEIFRDIGIQSNGRATVEVNADRKLVEVRYGA